MRSLIRFLLAAAFAAPLTAQNSPLPLIPLPREVARGARVPIANSLSIVHRGGSDDEFTARVIAASMKERRITVDTVVRAGRLSVERLRLGSPRAQQLLRDRRLTFNSVMTDEGYARLADSLGVSAISRRGLCWDARCLRTHGPTRTAPRTWAT